MSLNKTKPEKKGIIGKVFFWVIACIVAILLAIILLVTFMIRSAPQPPLLFGYSFIPLTSSETFPKGDLVICKALSLEEVSDETNIDVIYRKTTEGNTSALALGHCTGTEKTDGVLRFKLDNEEEISQTEIIGAVSLTIPHLGGFVVFIKTPLGLIFCVAVPLLLLLIFEVANLIKLSRSPKADEDDEQTSDEEKLPSYMRLDNINEMKRSETDKEGMSHPKAPLPLDETNITDEIVSKLNRSPLFEQVNEKLEVVNPRGPFQSLSYKKPAVSEKDVNKPSIYSTKEWELPPIEKSPPVMPITAVPKPAAKLQETVIVQPSAKHENDFMANIGEDSKNHFNIEGIDVRVLANAVKLSLDEGQQNRDISITVTNEYTNVVVDSENYEVNFALFKDDSDKEQKVIIQKKSKT